MVIEAELGHVLAEAERLERETKRLVAADPALADRYAAAGDRLANSVVRPLREAGARLHSDRASEPAISEDAAPGDTSAWDQAVWALAREATALRVRFGQPAELLEATAALQDVARSLAADAQAREQRCHTLTDLQQGLAVEIVPQRDGPYLVTNPPRLESWLGTPIETTPQMALCRCGQSKIKPLCDGSHRDTGFRDDKDPDRVPDRRDMYVGQQVTIFDNRGICQHAGLLHRPARRGLPPGEEPFVDAERGADGRDHPRRAGLPVRGTQLCH